MALKDLLRVLNINRHFFATRMIAWTFEGAINPNFGTAPFRLKLIPAHRRSLFKRCLG